jgi:hypothetical protein
VIVPGKIIPYAAASAQWGWRLPVRRVLRLLWSWRWWLGVAVATALGLWLPGKFFAGVPHGTVSAQVWAVGLKLAGAYLLAVGCWVLLLAWAAVLFGRQQPPPEESLAAVPVLAGPGPQILSATAETPAAQGGEQEARNS